MAPMGALNLWLCLFGALSTAITIPYDTAQGFNGTVSLIPGNFNVSQVAVTPWPSTPFNFQLSPDLTLKINNLGAHPGTGWGISPMSLLTLLGARLLDGPWPFASADIFASIPGEDYEDEPAAVIAVKFEPDAARVDVRTSLTVIKALSTLGLQHGVRALDAQILDNRQRQLGQVWIDIDSVPPGTSPRNVEVSFVAARPVYHSLIEIRYQPGGPEMDLEEVEDLIGEGLEDLQRSGTLHPFFHLAVVASEPDSLTLEAQPVPDTLTPNPLNNGQAFVLLLELKKTLIGFGVSPLMFKAWKIEQEYLWAIAKGSIYYSTTPSLQSNSTSIESLNLPSNSTGKSATS